MTSIYDNLSEERTLVQGLRSALFGAQSADICIGYFFLRGWEQISPLVDRLSAPIPPRCRILVGMQRPSEEKIAALIAYLKEPSSPTFDRPTIERLRRQVVQTFKEQTQFGIPTTQAEQAFRNLARQLRTRNVEVKVHLQYPLHAKLYLIHDGGSAGVSTAFIGSSNLSLAGLRTQGELNIQVNEPETVQGLQRWFEQRWTDGLSLDITEDLAEILEQSWARETLISPYHIYLKIAYHLSEQARLSEKIKLPDEVDSRLLPFQKEAVRIACQLINSRKGALLGDVVGLGKTIMAAAVARTLQDDRNWRTLIISPPNLTEMWENHKIRFRLNAKVMSSGGIHLQLPEESRDYNKYELVIIDESQNFRNRKGKRYQRLQNYIRTYGSAVLLLSATPYNMHLTDLSNQLRLFIDEDADLQIRPEQYIKNRARERQVSEHELYALEFQDIYARSLRAFELSDDPEDWVSLMSLYLVRRTRKFIVDVYCQTERGPDGTLRPYLDIPDEEGTPRRFYFPTRQPKNVRFQCKEGDPSDQYARLYNDYVVSIIEDLALPRYGLAQYLDKDKAKAAGGDDAEVIRNLNRAGRRLIGFTRANLLKRLESSGSSFLLSVHRHIQRNNLLLYALQAHQNIPIGSQNVARLDPAVSDLDSILLPSEDEDIENDFRESDTDAGAALYEEISSPPLRDKFDWLSPDFFDIPQLLNDLKCDNDRFQKILEIAGRWEPERDEKLHQLFHLVQEVHRSDKVLIFTQFADTAEYLYNELKRMGVSALEVCYGQRRNPYRIAQRFSPISNKAEISDEDEIRVLISTDVLAEGQNLQDCNIVVNYDLPWAIIRIIQRAGRVDRIGQESGTVLVYSFLPMDGLEKLIKLRKRLVKRLRQNSEVLGSDEIFFDEVSEHKTREIYTEKAHTLDVDEGDIVDLYSRAQQVWNSADEEDRKIVESLPNLVYGTRFRREDSKDTPGVLLYLRLAEPGAGQDNKTPEAADFLVRADLQGNIISENPVAVFEAAKCEPGTSSLPPIPGHHDAVRKVIEKVMEQEVPAGSGFLGTRRSVQRKLYERLRTYRERLQRAPDLFTPQTIRTLDGFINLLVANPLVDSFRDKVSRELRLRVNDAELLRMLENAHKQGKLVRPAEPEEQEIPPPQIICSMGIRQEGTEQSEAGIPSEEGRTPGGEHQ